MPTLGYALLGLLAQDALTGYELARRLEQRISQFWEARHSQIYPELKRLERAGLVTSQRDTTGRKKKTYRLTRAGAEQLKAWLHQPPEPPPLREELLLKAFLGWLIPGDALASTLRAEAGRMQKVIAELEAVPARVREFWGEKVGPGHPGFGGIATARLGLARARATAEWCKTLASEVEGLPAGRASVVSDKR